MENKTTVIRQVCHELCGYDTPPLHLDLMLSTSLAESYLPERVGIGFYSIMPYTAMRILKTYLVLGNNDTDTGRKIKVMADYVMRLIYLFEPNKPFTIPTFSILTRKLSRNDEFNIAIARLIYHTRVQKIPAIKYHPYIWKEFYSTIYSNNTVENYVALREKYHVSELIENEYKKCPYQSLGGA